MAPTTVTALAIFTLAIAPGFLLVRGYARRRYKAVPDRDLYALAQAIVVSAIWLGLVWVFLLRVGDPIGDWGLLPPDSHAFGQHRADSVLLGLTIITIPYGIGMVAAAAVDALGKVENEGIWQVVRWTGLFRPPTAWDRAWLTFDRKQKAGEVVVRLKDGLVIRGAYGRGAGVDLSPNPHQLFLTSGYGYAEGDQGEIREEPRKIDAEGRAGVFIEGSEIVAIYFQQIDSEEDDGDVSAVGSGEEKRSGRFMGGFRRRRRDNVRLEGSQEGATSV